MTTVSFLPVLQRELRVASRRRINYWSRVMAAGVAMLLSLSIVAAMELLSGGPGSSRGAVVFSVLKALSFAFVSLAGIFLTADSLSEEKREGTMGLLFLTDLRGYDVVFGKLGATSMRAVYGLLAAFPVLALGFLLGGVTAQEFWRLVLVLCNTLFVSLVVGIFISSLSHDAQKAIGGTLLLLSVLFFVPWGVDWWIADWKSVNFVARLSIASPLWAFLETGNRTREFWHGLGFTHGLGWLLLISASALSARNWQEKVVATPSATPTKSRRAMRSASSRERLLAVNPVSWLAAKRSWLSNVSRWLVLISILAWIVFALPGLLTSTNAPIGMGLAYISSRILILAVASQASGFFIETKRAGLLELLLVAPLQPHDIIAGHAKALRRMFLFPAIVLALLVGVSSMQQLLQFYQNVASTGQPSGGGFNFSFMIAQQLISYLRNVLGILTSCWAVAWFGMWMGLTNSKPHVALIKTIVFAQVLPWFALMMIQPLSFLLVRQGNLIWTAFLLNGVLALGSDIAFAIISQRQVHKRLRVWSGDWEGDGGRESGGRGRESRSEAVPASRAYVDDGG